MKHIAKLLFAGALAFGAVSAANAFTFESAAPGDGGMHQNYTDPDDQIQPKAGSPQRFDNGSQSGQRDGFYMNFGGQTQSFDQRYNADNLFNPFTRDGR
ncbi:MAG TPA: hypothetical protein VFA57_18475 [Pseudolabrys sp.]|nr:hypothetical protein [Pseudolabrys sp.]